MGWRCIKRWLRYGIVTLFLSYLGIIYLLLAKSSSRVEVQEMFQLPILANETATRNWQFEPDAHAHFHKEQEKLMRIKRQQELEKARRESAEKIFLNPSTREFFPRWANKRTKLRGCNVEIFDSKIAVLHNVTVDASKAKAKALGGEKIQDVLNRPDDHEMYTVNKGFFKVPTSVNSSCGIKLEGRVAHLKMWSQALEAYHGDTLDRGDYIQNTTILITRYEYANVYWAVMDLYDVYLTTVFLNQTMNTTNVLIIDAHPYTPLDDLWQGAFNTVQRPHQLPPVSTHQTLAWTFGREFGPMLNKGAYLPLIHEFRDTILQSFNLPTNHQPNCQRLNILFIWRRNYVAHPRNPAGVISRKIANEEELLTAARRYFPQFNITGVQLDALPILEQLKILSQTDIFIGMHGAAFGFTVLLPPGSGVVELFPYGFVSNWHMEYLAKKSGHHYYVWKNDDKTLEDVKNKYTKVPPDIVTDLLSKAMNKLCHAHTRMEARTRMPMRLSKEEPNHT